MSRFAGQTPSSPGGVRHRAGPLPTTGRQGATLALSDVDDAGLAETVTHVRRIGVNVRSDRLDVPTATASCLRGRVAEQFGAVTW